MLYHKHIIDQGMNVYTNVCMYTKQLLYTMACHSLYIHQ